jgi:hypothetical protein
VPLAPWYGSTEWHPEPQWLLKARDVAKGAERDFAIKDIGFKPALENTPAPVSEITEEMVDGKALLAAINKLPRCVMETHSNNGDVFVSFTKVRAAITAAMGGE